jgi:4-hydroxyproline epimerase
MSVLAIDSHTGGEPTRVIIEGGPALTGTLAERQHAFKTKWDDFRASVCNEPRGSDVLVGALLQAPSDPTCTAGVIFFNNVDTLGMCGHGTIGLITTLHHLGRIKPGIHPIETPVGVVTTQLFEDGRVSVRNVRSYRHRAQVAVNVEGLGVIHGDIAWGGNWFFICEDHGLTIERSQLPELMVAGSKIRAAIEREKITGAQNGLIDHIELTSKKASPDCNGRNFVLCPGLAYDRSPCGTGTSAKLACLAADQQLKPGEIWRQESIIGSVFEGAYEPTDDGIIPTITGRAHITAELSLVFDSQDPYVNGIR